jgi:hypothetical protein
VPYLGPKRGWGPEQVTGEPDVAIPGLDDMRAWASLSQDDQDEWLLLTYANPVVPAKVKVYETLCPGALCRVSVIRQDGVEVEVWAGKDPTPPDRPHGISEVPIVGVTEPVKQIKLYLDSKNVPGWNEIDAVGLVDASGQTHWAVTVRASSTYATGR